jgi:hypothetical protein
MSAHSAAVEELARLAEEFASAGAPLQAIKCLEAVAQSEQPPLPLAEVRARLRAASLLLEYTDNVHVAKSHLERAVRAHAGRSLAARLGAAPCAACGPPC